MAPKYRRTAATGASAPLAPSRSHSPPSEDENASGPPQPIVNSEVVGSDALLGFFLLLPTILLAIGTTSAAANVTASLAHISKNKR